MERAEETPCSGMKCSMRVEQADRRLQPKREQEGQEDKKDDDKEGRPQVMTKHKTKRRQGSATMCELCNIQLNSGAQAQIHYKGRTHRRRLRRLAKAVATGVMSKGHINPLYGSLPLFTGSLQSQALMEHFQHLRSNTPHNLLLSFNMTQTKAHCVHKHACKLITFDTRRKQTCGNFTLKGKDMEREKRMTLGNTRLDLKESTDGSTPVTCWSAQRCPKPPERDGGEKQETQDKPKETKFNNIPLHCPTCKVKVNSSVQLQDHLNGLKHKQKLEGKSQHRFKIFSTTRQNIRPRQSPSNKSRGPGSRQPFYCDRCQVSVNSGTQLQQHMNSRRHKQLFRQQVKPKSLPINNLQFAAALANNLILHNQQTKILRSDLQSNPLNATPFCTLSSPFTPQAAQGPTAILQGSLISPRLFMPAPGPLRASNPPLIFSPYV